MGTEEFGPPLLTHIGITHIDDYFKEKTMYQEEKEEIKKLMAEIITDASQIELAVKVLVCDSDSLQMKLDRMYEKFSRHFS
jgi:GTP-binding protein EngB required for normal cell division